MPLGERWSPGGSLHIQPPNVNLRSVPAVPKGSRQLAAGAVIIHDRVAVRRPHRSYALRVIPRLRRKGRTIMSASTEIPSGHERDTADLAQFGYKQELKRSLGTFSSFAVAFSYISPSTGIFTLFALGLTSLGGVFIWTWPVAALGQVISELKFAEVSSHYPVAGSVFQWTKYLAHRSYSWF